MNSIPSVFDKNVQNVETPYWRELKNIEMDFPSYIDYLIENGFVRDDIFQYSIITIRGSIDKLTDDGFLLKSENGITSTFIMHASINFLTISKKGFNYSNKELSFEELKKLDKSTFILGRNQQEMLEFIAVLK